MVHLPEVSSVMEVSSVIVRVAPNCCATTQLAHPRGQLCTVAHLKSPIAVRNSFGLGVRHMVSISNTGNVQHASSPNEYHINE